MLAQCSSAVLSGITAHKILVEVDVARGLPGFHIVGLAENAVKESRERVRSAIKNSGYEFPNRRITVNLAPADIKKMGTGLDLPIAMAILQATGTITTPIAPNLLFIGELSLDGSIRPTRGILPICLGSTRWFDAPEVFVPKDNALEGGIVEGVCVRAAAHLSEIVEHILGNARISPTTIDVTTLLSEDDGFDVDFKDVLGQEHAKRALEIAAAGGHNCLLSGPPGSGKTMLARRLPTILPPMTIEEALETTSIHSIAGTLARDQALIIERPFCTPHHTVSDAGMVGGGTWPRPGQVSLAHNGVLFLDELPEFKKNVLEALRQPLEDGTVTVSRVQGSITYPANFTLVAAQNLCPCGRFGDGTGLCNCTETQIARYRFRASGPLMDRIDLHIEVPKVPVEDLGERSQGESSYSIRKRVVAARKIQQERFKDCPIFSNARMAPGEIEHFCRLTDKDREFLKKATGRLGLSARAFHKILKVARTIADLEGMDSIKRHHIAEAIQYRSMDGNALA